MKQDYNMRGEETREPQITKDELKTFLANNPEYIEILENALEFEENTKKEDHAFLRDEPYDTFWKYQNVGAHPNRVYQLELKGIIDRPHNTKNTTTLVLSDREFVRDVLDDINSDMGDDAVQIVHDFPEENELPEDLFEEIIGYDDIKWLLKRSLSTDKIINFILIGPPGSAKTLFLMSIYKLKGAEFVFGSEATSAGYFDEIFEKQPKYMLFDEIGDMSNKDQKSLAQFTEDGILSETKFGKNREMHTNANTYATANYKENIVDKILDRFTVLEFEKYDYEEFIQVCEHLLPMREGKNEEEAKLIADAVWKSEGHGDVRKAIQIARLSRGDPEKVIDVIDEYSSTKKVLSFKSE